MQNKVVVITGASQGIGLALSEIFSEAGYFVGRISRNIEQSIQNTIPNSMVINADVRNINHFRSAVEKIEQKFGQIDYFINNAGVSHIADFTENAHEINENIFQTNVLGVMNGLEIILPKMRAQNKGTIINMSSIADRGGRPLSSVYGASKAAVKSLSETLRAENSQYGIRITNVAPALIDTPMIDKDHPEYKTRINPTEFAKIVLWICEQPESICIRDICLAPNRV